MKNPECSNELNDFERFSADGRLPIGKLYTEFDMLRSNLGWRRKLIFNQTETQDGRRLDLPVFVYHSPYIGKALWIIAGIHGEEPAGPNAIAKNIDIFTQLHQQRIPTVVIPLCNPLGYFRDWRYFNVRRDWRRGKSVGDAEHNVPHPHFPHRARKDEPSSQEAFKLTETAIALSRKYPPLLSIDFHEDESMKDRHIYIYSHGVLGPDDPIAHDVKNTLKAAEMPLRLEGHTSFGEPIQNGIVSVHDGSLDHLLSATQVFHCGNPIAGPSAHSAIVTETPTVGTPLEKRVEAYAEILSRLTTYWQQLKAL